MKSKSEILGYGVYDEGLDSLRCDIKMSIEKRRRAWLACFNPHSYVQTLHDIEFAESLRSSNWLVPDGVGVVWASFLLGGRIRQRITGHDVFDLVNDYLNEVGGSVFFLGSTEENLQKIKERFISDYPNAIFSGSYSPPYKDSFDQSDSAAMLKAINSAKPDVLWVGMTAPKQERWIFSHVDDLDVAFAGAIGAVFDFYTGNVRRSHPIFQKCGLEWLPRLVKQPKRLWRRMFLSAPIFLAHLIKQIFKRGDE